MNVSTDELRDALQAYAAEVPLPDADSLVAGAGRKRAHARKVRTAVIAGAAAVVMVVVTAVGIQGIGHEKALTPAQLNEKFHTHYAEYTHGLKLTNIVSLPVQVDPGGDNVSSSTASASVSVTVPKIGSATYIGCDPRYFSSAADIEASGTDPRVIGPPVTNGDCNTFGQLLPTYVPAGSTSRWSVSAPYRPTKNMAPVAIYTQVAWDSRSAGSKTLRPAPAALDPKQPEYGQFVEMITGSGDHTSTKTFRVPEKADSLGAGVMIRPSTTGRFQVIVNGHAQPLDYSPLPAKYAAVIVADKPPEVRGTWFEYFPDSGSQDGSGVAMVETPPPGKPITVTIRAVDTTGPWQVMLGWQKKQ